jgi:PAS domain S-box-containing protein
MFRSLRRKVGARIILGYLIALSLLAGVGGLAVVRLNQINTTVADLTENLARDRELAGDIVYQTLSARFYVNRYIRTQAQEDRDRFEETFAELNRLLAQADQQITAPERIKMLNRVKPAVQQYGAIFSAIAKLINRRQQTQSEVLDVQGLVIENRLTALRVSLTTVNEPALFLSFGNAQNAFQVMRLHVSHYLEEGDESYAVLVENGYRQGQEALATLEAEWQDPVQRQNSASARAAFEAYYQGFQTIQTDYATLKALLKTGLDELEPEISAAASEIAASVEQDLKAKNESTRALVNQTRLVLIAAGVGALVVALVIGVRLSRGITGPLQQVMRASQRVADVDLRALTAQLSTLAQGHLALHLDVTARRLEIDAEDEVGQMAMAFNDIIASLHQAGRAFQAMAAYLNEMAGAAASVAQGDLDVEVAVRSEQDVLGQAVTRMLANLRAAREQVQSQMERLAALRDIDSRITTSLDLHAILGFLLEQAVALLHIDAAEIYLFDSRTQQLKRYAQAGLPLSRDSGSVVDIEKHCAGAVVKEIRPIRVNNVAASERPLPCALREDVGAYYGLPLVVQDQIKGVLQVINLTPLDPSVEWMDFIETLAGQAAIAIAHVELVKGLEERVAARTAELEAQKEALRQSEQRLSLHVQQTPLAVIEWNLNFEVTAWNPAAEIIFGYTRDEALGRHAPGLIVPESAQDQVSQVWDDLFARKGGTRSTNENVTQDGRPIWCEWYNTPLIDQDGQVIGVASLVQDITDRKHAEEQLQRYSVELAQSNEEIKRFAYIVSHDLRAPLVNLKGFAAELRSALAVLRPAFDDLLPQLNAPQRQAAATALHQDVPEALDFIESSVDRMDRFINALLKLSRLGRRDLRLEPVDMNAVVQAILKTLAHQIEDRQVRVRVEPLPEVIADRTSMEQIMGNILDNAVKYLEPNRPGEITITAQRDFEQTTFHIRDNGRGIAQADMDKVFAPFRRAGRQDVPGEGMGLSYVQALVRRHGGQIGCESEPGVGTTFTFSISSPLTKGDEHDA